MKPPVLSLGKEPWSISSSHPITRGTAMVIHGFAPAKLRVKAFGDSRSKKHLIDLSGYS